jgi:arylsulfatase A-like enzyme
MNQKRKSSAKPNIVFIMADQLGAKFLNCYGGGVDSTPVLDQLASRGTLFSRCYATHPMCAPNRATMLTGRSAEVHGVVKNNLVLQPDQLTYTQILQRNGYRTGGFGKFHHDPMHLPPPANYQHLGFDETVITEDPKLGAWLDWIKQDHPEYYETALAVSWPMPWASSYGSQQENLLPQINAAREKILNPIIQQSSWGVMHPSPLPKELHQTTFITDRTLDFIKRHQAEHADHPFFTFVSYVDPHDPYDPPAPYDRMFSPEDMSEPILPEKDPLPIKVLEDSRDFNGFRSISTDIEAIRKLRALYHGSIRFIDDQIGRLVEFLKENSLIENTIIIFTTDHGDMMGDHGLITKGVKHYDAGIRCPLIVSGAGITPGVVDRLVCSLDFFPTLCDWAGAETRPPLEGLSFAPDCAGQNAENTRPAVTVQAQNEPNGGQALSLITEDGWRLTQYDHPSQAELFNLTNDPDERTNLYGQPEHEVRRRELQKMLTCELMRRTETIRRRNLPVVNGRVLTFSKDHPWIMVPDGLN